jgi:opacity protein-like surface antigen
MKTKNMRSFLLSRLPLLASVFLAPFVSLAAAQASAQQSPVYMSGAIGQADWGNAEMGGRSAGGREMSYGFDLGYRINKLFAVELGYGDFGKAKIEPADFSGATLRARSISASAVMSYPVTGDFSVFGQLGAARTRRTLDEEFVRTAITTGSVGTDGTVITSTSYVNLPGGTTRENKTEAIFGLGASYAISNDAQVFARFQKLADTKVEVWQIGTRFTF